MSGNSGKLDLLERIQKLNAKIARQEKQLKKSSGDIVDIVEKKCSMLLEILELRNKLDRRDAVMKQQQRENSRLAKLLDEADIEKDSHSVNIEKCVKGIGLTRQALEHVTQENDIKDNEIENLKEKVARFSLTDSEEEEEMVRTRKVAQDEKRNLFIRRSLDSRGDIVNSLNNV